MNIHRRISFCDDDDWYTLEVDVEDDNDMNLIM